MLHMCRRDKHLIHISHFKTQVSRIFWIFRINPAPVFTGRFPWIRCLLCAQPSLNYRWKNDAYSINNTNVLLMSCGRGLLFSFWREKEVSSGPFMQHGHISAYCIPLAQCLMAHWPLDHFLMIRHKRATRNQSKWTKAINVHRLYACFSASIKLPSFIIL